MEDCLVVEYGYTQLLQINDVSYIFFLIDQSFKPKLIINY